jgi:phage shock protein E
MHLHDEDFLRRAAAARARIEQLQPDDLEQQLDGGAVLIDVRDPSELRSGTIRHARNIPLDGLTQRIDSLLPDRTTPIVVSVVVAIAVLLLRLPCSITATPM